MVALAALALFSLQNLPFQQLHKDQFITMLQSHGYEYEVEEPAHNPTIHRADHVFRLYLGPDYDRNGHETEFIRDVSLFRTYHPSRGISYEAFDRWQHDPHIKGSYYLELTGTVGASENFMVYDFKSEADFIDAIENFFNETSKFESTVLAGIPWKADAGYESYALEPDMNHPISQIFYSDFDYLIDKWGWKQADPPGMQVVIDGTKIELIGTPNSPQTDHKTDFWMRMQFDITPPHPTNEWAASIRKQLEPPYELVKAFDGRYCIQTHFDLAGGKTLTEIKQAILDFVSATPSFPKA